MGRSSSTVLDFLELLLHHFDLVRQHLLFVQFLGFLQQFGRFYFASFLHSDSRKAQFSHGDIVGHSEPKLQSLFKMFFSDR